MPKPRKVSKHQRRVRMARIRLIAGTGCRKARMVANSVKAIQDNWGVKAGRIRVQVLGKVDDLPAGLKAIVNAAGPELCIERRVMVDLCGQRSEERGSGCDAPAEISNWPTSSDGAGKSSKGLRTPVTPSLRPPKPQRNQRRKYAWRNSSHTDVCMCIRMLKSSKEEEVKCLGSLNVLNAPPLRQPKMMTSLSSRMQKAGERNSLSSRKIREDINNSEIGLDNHKGSNMNHNNPKLGLKSERKKQEVASRREQTKSYDVMDDDIMTSSDTTPESRGNKLVARKPRQDGKNILLYSVEDFLKWLPISFQTITLVVLLLTIVTNVTNGLVHIRPHERMTLIGNSANFLSAVVNSSTVILSFLLMIQLHKLAILTAIFIGLGVYLHVESLEKPCGRPKGGIKKLHNTRIREKKIGSSDNFRGYVRPMMQHLAGSVLAGKRLCAYIFLYTHFYATRMFYISKYMVNLGLGDKYQALISLIYLYIYVMYHSWVSCYGVTHLPQILTKSYTLAYFVSKLVTLRIKSHKKYQSNFLDRLGHVERANGKKRSILGHNRLHWSGLRPLVTPWEFCIKEGTEPWKNQLRSLTSPVQVSNSLLSLSLSLSLSLLSSCPAMIYCSCCYLLLSLLCIFTCIGSIMTVVMNTNLVINIAQARKANLDLSIAKVKSSLSFFLLGGSIGLAGVAMLINITISLSLSLFSLLGGLVGLAGVAMPT